MNQQLPERPDLGQLKKQAKDLLDKIRDGDAVALERTGVSAAAVDAFALHDAQRIVAREYGFPSWAKLKLHVETRTEQTAEVRLIEAACEGEAEVVTAILQERPALANRTVAAAAALGNRAALDEILSHTPSAATTKTGPRDWEPLLYLCFGQCGAGDEVRASAAQRLLAGGADPNGSWIHPTWPESPLPALYGATGRNNYPQLARVLLKAGANPNDGESRYHAAEHNHVASLEALAEFGADFSGIDRIWGNTPLCFLFGYVHASDTVRAGLRWLLEHGANPNAVSYAKTTAETALHTAVRSNWDVPTIELLLRHGADPALMRADGRTAYALAICAGRDDVAETLRAHGAPVQVSPVDQFLGACAQANEPAARRLLQEDPAIMQKLSGADQRIAITAARDGYAGALEVMGRVGFNLGIADEDGATALHWAAWHGQADAVRVLLAHGVHTDVNDRRFDAPPMGWCAHGSLYCGAKNGRYGEIAEALIQAGVVVPPATEGSPEVMAVLKKHVGGKAR